ncbi:26S proteasome non-ATPase regulatory subunit 2-like [Sycon ciliatum]|uniref:26S proteasome non-ATPase regulatory subunit 2-like n=1 Tax=Sycon ciliatum TaxID=27933 RepID=UPI0031F66A13
MAEGDEEKKPSGESGETTNPPVVEESELSEEDRQLQDDLLMLVERLQESQAELHGPTLESLRTLIRSSTSSMTSVPKPLKFLRPHYGKFKSLYAAWSDDALKQRLADIISVLAMTQPDSRDTLDYRILGSSDALESWGHEYVRHISAQVGQMYTENNLDELGALSNLVDDIIPFNMKHNAEAEACDLLMELERTDDIRKFVDKNTYERVCLYLVSCVRYVPSPEDEALLDTCMKIYLQFEQYAQAMRMAMMKSNRSVAESSSQEVFAACDDELIKKQLAFIAGRQQYFLTDEDGSVDIVSNGHLSTHFLMLARELDILEPKSPEDIYKTHLESHRPSFGAAHIDSARQNLASSFVNGFVNCAYCKDKLMTLDGNKWIYKNKDSGMLSATASLGLILLWDVDGGLSSIDKYLYSNNDHIKAGALLACGIVNNGVRNDCDPALALLSDYVSSDILCMRIASILGLGLAYAGTNIDYVVEAISSPMTDGDASVEVLGVTSLALGLVTVGQCNGDVTLSVLQAMMDLDPKVIVKDKNARMLAISLALCSLGRPDAADAFLETLKTLPSSYCSFASVLVEACSKAGTGDVLAVQNLLHICSESLSSDSSAAKKEDAAAAGKDSPAEPSASATAPGLAPGVTVTDGPAATDATDDKKKEDSKEKKDEKEKDGKDKEKKAGGAHQGAAVIGIALIAMGEEIGQEMVLRSYAHLLHYGEPVIRRAVPLGLALLSVGDPKLKVLDTLSKLSHDLDQEVALSAILALGIVGAGTNNARLAAMLRQLAQYYYKDDNCLFMTRIAQGLTHLGKGTLTLSPYHSDRSILSSANLSGLLSLLVMCLDMKGTLLGNRHYFLYLLTTAIQPRMLITLDEDLTNISVTVRVGQAVDVVGQAGKPKTITGFQTHTTPVLLQAGERAELATDQYEPVTPILEGFVILKKVEGGDDDN